VFSVALLQVFPLFFLQQDLFAVVEVEAVPLVAALFLQQDFDPDLAQDFLVSVLVVSVVAVD